nr:uncharacterized protein LOC100333256 [Danio rerio]|eukprot:XP_021327848.1 uncharacterized protein LOC100333256 [Danio rerio]
MGFLWVLQCPPPVQGHAIGELGLAQAHAQVIYHEEQPIGDSWRYMLQICQEPPPPYWQWSGQPVKAGAKSQGMEIEGFLVWYTCKHYDSLKDSIVLPCHADKDLSKGSLKVEWRRADSGTLVHLYQGGKSQPEAQQQDYHGRAHFFTEEIQDGNFSLCLDKLRDKDKGEYRCRVYSAQNCVFSASIQVVEGFDIQCTRQTLAPLGSSVVLPCYIRNPSAVKGLKVEWRRADDTVVHLYQDNKSQPEAQQQENHDEEIQHGNFFLQLDKLREEDEARYTYSIFRVQMFLVFCPNILMFLAFVCWGFSEGSLFESVSCCALYFLRPLMLLWAAPYANSFTGNTKSFIQSYSFRAEYVAFSAVFYSVLFKTAWDKSLNYAGYERVVIIILFVMVLLLDLIYISFLMVRVIEKLSQRIKTIFSVLARISFDVLPSLQFILLFFAFGSARAAFVVVVLPVFLTVQKYNWDFTCGEQMGCLPLVRRSVWFILTLFINAIMVHFYIIALENEKDCVGWACMIMYFQLIWATRDFTISFECDLHPAAPVYVFGSVVVVLLNSVTLMTELVLKTVNGEGAVGDLRVVVFSSEFIFTFFLMIFLVFKACPTGRRPQGRHRTRWRDYVSRLAWEQIRIALEELDEVFGERDPSAWPQKTLCLFSGFTVGGPSAPLSAPLGSSVVLTCYVDEALPVEDLEVEWRRVDSSTLVHLYQDGESRAEVQQQDYHDRAHFFTEEIQHGNFSLRLDNLTAQDEGEYRCRVHSQQDSGETVAQIKDVERLLVSGSDESIFAYVGEDVTLNCSVDSHITPEHIEEVSWKKADKGGDFPVLLYQNSETVSEATHDKFRGRVEFFTAKIPKGNFSLRLKSVRTEDKGVYMCQVFAGDLSASVTVVLKRLGFSVLHIIMMILCVSASGSALLLCFMIYCRSTKGIIQPFVSLGSSVVLPCYVDKPVKHLKVEWKRADLDSDSETLVHLYQDGESRAEVQQQDYHDRAHFFTEEFQHGNFSLRLDNLGTEDAGEYRCRVHSQHNHVFSTKVILELEYDHSSSLAGFIVKTPSGPLVIPLGSSVILPCYCNKDLSDLRVEWRRSDLETLVHLYQDGESLPEEQDEDEQNRAHFFT